MMQQTDASTEISFTEMYQVAQRHWRWLAAVSLLAAVIAWVVVSQVTPIWEATGTVQVGMVGQICYPGKICEFTKVNEQGDLGEFLENPVEVTGRMRSPNFKLDALQKAGATAKSPTAHDPESSAVKSSLLKGTNLIELSAEDSSPQGAKDLLAATVELIKKDHDKIFENRTGRIKRALASVQERIELRKKPMTLLENKLGAGANSSENLLQASLLSTYSSELMSLEEKRDALEVQLSPEHSFNTHLVSEIHVSDKPIYPSKLKFIIIGALIGFFVAFALALAMNTLKLRKRA
jgi:capsular polysaccharide biosynthesis protein